VGNGRAATFDKATEVIGENMATYKLKHPRFDHPAGTIVYDFVGHDYGLARQDTMEYDVEHVSVTINEDNSKTPFFTVAVTDLERIDE
jgi:hypothetical protein